MKISLKCSLVSTKGGYVTLRKATTVLNHRLWWRQRARFGCGSLRSDAALGDGGWRYRGVPSALQPEVPLQVMGVWFIIWTLKWTFCCVVCLSTLSRTSSFHTTIFSGFWAGIFWFFVCFVFFFIPSLIQLDKAFDTKIFVYISHVTVLMCRSYTQLLVS